MFGAPTPELPAPMVAQAWQDHAEGIATGPAVYLAKIGDYRLGAPKRDTIPDPDNVNEVIRRETQVYETTFQAMGIWSAPDAALTAADLANRAAAILQSDLGLDFLRAADVGILRVGQVRNPKFVNGADEYEASPSFDFVLTYKQVTLTKHPAAVVDGLRVYPV
jgi:hypothetical protein